MPGFADTALRLLRRILATPDQTGDSAATPHTLLDGNSAVALVEAAISEASGLGASFPADGAQLAWRAEQQRTGRNLWGGPLAGLPGESPRGALAAAAGLSMSGLRATTFLSGTDLAAVQDLLALLAGRHIPLVAHVSNRAIGGQSSALGSGHEACHLSADSGCFILIAANVQEAADLSMIARRASELTLLPGVVCMDGEQTALSIQEVRLPTRELAERFLGRPEELIDAPSPAQKMVFGSQRRRVPRWHDPDRPVMLGALQPMTGWGLAKASASAYLDRSLEEALEQSLTLFAGRTGRRHRSVSTHRVEDAQLIMLAMGSLIETAEAVADHLRAHHRMKVGVLGLRSLRPFPGSQITGHLGRCRTLCVLERLDAPLSAAPPLLREVTAAIELALESGRNEKGADPDHPARSPADRPRLLSVRYGLGGLPVRATDLVELCLQSPRIERGPLYLGISFAHATTPYPKRQALLDRLARDYPELAGRGVTGQGVPPDLRPDGAFTIAISRVAGMGGGELALEAQALIGRVADGQMRSRPALLPAPWGSPCSDCFTWAPKGLRDPGDQPPPDLAVVTAEAIRLGIAPGLTPGRPAALLIEGPDPERPPPLPGYLGDPAARGEIALFLSGSPEDGSGGEEPTLGLRGEHMLGALFGVLLQRNLLDATARRLLSSRETTLSSLPEPVRTARLQAFADGLQGVARIEAGALPMAPPPGPSPEVPLPLRRLRNIDDAYDTLARFWDHTGVLSKEPGQAQPCPDPYLAIGALPPRSSEFRDLGPLQGRLPAFDAAACTGCGACWSLCPDGAIAATAVTAGRLLEAGVRITGLDAFRPMLPALESRILGRCRERGSKPVSVGALLADAAARLQEKALPEGRRTVLEQGLGQLTEAIGGLPLAVTEPLFLDPEQRTKGSGELLLLTIDPAACKGCGICIDCCEPDALSAAAQGPDIPVDSSREWQAMEQLQERLEESSAPVPDHSPLGDLAATMLTWDYARTLAGGDGSEPGSGERLTLRLALAAAESEIRPRIDRFCAEVAATREKISGLIRKMLADAVPADDLDALALGLEQMAGEQLDLAQFINQAEGAVDTGIDPVRLRRLVTLARQLQALHWQLSEGRQGFGRAALGLVFASDAPAGWAGVFPDNPFQAPVTLDTTGDAVQLAAGLQAGYLRHALEAFVLMRRARLELESPADAARNWSGLGELGWQELDEEERAITPPLLLVGSSALLAGHGLSQLIWILGSGLPVKLMVLAELDLGLASRVGADATPAPLPDPTLDLALLALSQRNACVVQSSVGAPEHLMSGLRTALAWRGPALLHVHAPSPLGHGFASDQTIRQARLAFQSRAFPLFVYDPQGAGVFGSRIDLQGNPEPSENWAMGPAGEPLTPAAWALGESRFSHLLPALTTDPPDARPLAEYLTLSEAESSAAIPFVSLAREARAAARLRVDPLLVGACRQRLAGWRTLQELAGVVTPFTARIEQQAQQRVASDHQAELQAVRDQYEARIAGLHQEALQQTRREVRERLMSMAGYDPKREENPHAAQ